MIDGMSKMYEEEEREIHIREQTDKARRVSFPNLINIRMKSG